MKNRKYLLSLALLGLLVSGCRNSQSNDNSSTSSTSSSSAKPVKTILKASDLNDLLNNTMSLPTSSLTYVYQEKMPNETKDFTIKNTYEVKATKNENFVKISEDGKETPIERYFGILDNVYYKTESGTGVDSALRKKIVDKVNSTDGEITLADAEKNVKAAQDNSNLKFLFSDGDTYSQAGKINFLNATDSKNTEVSFSSTLGEDGKETVHYVSYYEEASLELDDPISYDYDFTAVIEKGRLVSASLKGKAASIDNWDKEKHEPKEGFGTEMSYDLTSVTYVDALPETGNTALLSNLSSYFITSIQHASFQDYMTGEEAIIRAGDSFFSSLLTIDSFQPSTALDKGTITITSSSDESVIGKDEYGSFKALKVGSTNLTIGNIFNPNLYTIAVNVLPALPSVNGIKNLNENDTVELKVNESKTFDLDLSDYGDEGPWDLSAITLTGGENLVSSAFQMTGSNASDYGISLTLKGLKEGEATLTLEVVPDTYSRFAFKVKVISNDTRPTLTIPETEGVELSQISSGVSRHNKGDKVSFYADPKNGYAIHHVYLVQGDTKTELTAGSLNKYEFTMPDGDCSLEFDVSKLETATVSYSRPSYSVASEFKVFYNPNGSTEEKTISSGNSVNVGTKIQIKLSLIAGNELKSISVSDGSEVTTVTKNKLYSFILGSKDVTITFDIQKASASHSISIPKTNDYAIDSMTADGKVLYANNRVANRGQKIVATIYAYDKNKTLSAVSVVDGNGTAVAFTSESTMIDDPSFDPDFGHGDPDQLSAITVTFTMPDSDVTIRATLA